MGKRFNFYQRYEEWVNGDKSKENTLELDEGIILIRFIEQVNSLDKLLQNEQGDKELQQALKEKAEELKQYDLQNLCSLGISCGTFEVPVAELAKELNGLIERYKQSIAENNQSIIRATVPVKEPKNTPVEIYEITSELMVELQIYDETLRHWLRANYGEKEQQIKQDFIHSLQELEQLSQEIRQAKDKAAYENIISNLNVCYRSYSVKYHPDKIRSILKEEIAVKMFTTFRHYLEQIKNKDNNQGSASETYSDDHYSEEIIRLIEELIRSAEVTKREYEKTMKFCKEQDKQIEQI